MANNNNVEARISVDIQDYERGMRQASRTTEREGQRITNAIEEQGDVSQAQSRRIINVNNTTSRSYGTLRASTTEDMDRIRRATVNMSNTSGQASQDIIQDANRISTANNRMGDTSGRVSNAIRGYNQRISASSSQTAGNIRDDANRIRNANGTIQQSSNNTSGQVQQNNQDMAEAYENLAERVQEGAEKLSDFGNKLAGGSAGIAGALGTAGYMATAEADNSIAKIQSSLRLVKKDAEDLFNVAKEISFGGFEYEASLNGLITVKKELGKVLDPKQLKPFTEGALYIADIFEVDVKETVKATNSLIKNFGIDGAKSLDIITWGLQNGLNVSDDFIDTLWEYAPQMSKLGFTAEETLQIINKGMQDGAFNTDKLLDGVKEFRLRLSDIDDTGADALKKLGFNFETVQKEIGKSGDASKNMAMKVGLALSKIDDDVERNKLSVALFGTQYEDVGDSIYRALSHAKEPIPDLITSAESLGQAFEDDAKTKMLGFANEMKFAFEEIGKNIIPIVLEVTEKLADFLNWFGSLPKEVHQGIFIFLALGVVIGGFLSLIGGLVGSAIAIGVAVSTFALWAPIAGIITAVALAVGGLIAFLIGFDWDLFVEGGKQVFDFFGRIRDVFQMSVKLIEDTVLAWLGTIAWGLMEIVVQVGAFLLNILKTIWGGIKSIFVAITTPFMIASSVIQNIFEMIIENIKLSLEFIKALFTGDFEACGDIVGRIFGNIKKTISDIFGDAVKIVKDSIDKIKGFFDFSWELPKFKTPKLDWTGSFSLNPPTVPKLNVTWHAKGGIYKKPTLFDTNSGVHGVGEAGAEAILPLNKLPDLLGLDKKGNGDMVFNFYDTQIRGYDDLEQLSKEMGVLMRRRTV